LCLIVAHFEWPDIFWKTPEVESGAVASKCDPPLKS
jgi:hypothetical protein